MAYNSPETVLRICRGIPFDIGRNHTYLFENQAQQIAYFSNRAKYTINNVQYLRFERDMIKVQKPKSDLMDCNYIAFYNTNYESRWFYAFIRKIDYISDNTSAIYYDIDFVQTWLFDFKIAPGFVLREHTVTDDIGDNIEYEGLETGEYVSNRTYKNGGTVPINTEGYIRLGIMNKLCYIICSTKDMEGIYDNQLIEGYDPQTCVTPTVSNLPQGVGYFMTFSEQVAAETLWATNNFGVADSICAFFVFPKILVNYNSDIYLHSTRDPNETICQIRDGAAFVNASVSISDTLTEKPALRLNKFEDEIVTYKPWNNKMYTAPFTVLNLSDNLGNTATYRQEFFHEFIDFKFDTAMNPQVIVYGYPIFYSGERNNYAQGLTCSNGFPLLSVNESVYKEWLARNKASNGLAIASGIADIGVSIASYFTGTNTVVKASSKFSDYNSRTSLNGGSQYMSISRGSGWRDTDSTSEVISQNPAKLTGSIIGGVTKIANVMAATIDHSVIPNQARGEVSHGNINLASVDAKKNDFFLRIMTITEPYARKIDEYFSRYGYAVNMIKTPAMCNTNGTLKYSLSSRPRPRWNFLQMEDVKVQGIDENHEFNHEVENELENVLSKGITFWNPNVTMYDYTQTATANNKPV